MPAHPHVPRDEDRKLVKLASAVGVPQTMIARLVQDGIDDETLRKHYRQELDLGEAEATYAVARTLFKRATEGGELAAAIFWLKARAGWREKSEIVVDDKRDPVTERIVRARARAPHR